jgi:hypothetical protein
MTTLETILIIALLVSVIANSLAFWYMRRVLPGFIYTSQNLEDLTTLVANYREHLRLRNIYEMEMYYGDETIKHLMSHTTSLLEVLEDYEDVYSITTPFEEIYEEEDQNLKGDQPDGETQKNEENVFYTGSRRRDS